MSILLFVIVACVSFVISESARILGVYPTPSISHQIAFRPLMLELAKRGHDVVIITTDPICDKENIIENYTEIDVHNISYTLWNEFMELSKGSESDLTTQIKVAFALFVKIFEAQFRTEEVQGLITDSKRFDLIFVEACVRSSLSLAYLYDAPVIQFSSFGGFYETFEDFGAPIQPLLYPIALNRRLYNLTFWEKLSELHFYYSFKSIVSEVEIYENQMLKRLFGPDIPALSELRKRVQMVFLNVHSIWDFNRPVPPNVLYLGGLHQKEGKDLPQELNRYLNTSIHGVIYMSFGTNVRPSLLPPEKINIFTKVFSKLPYDILMKWDMDSLPNSPSNVKTFKWLPQSDLLRHPNIKMFITQGGLQSTDEAISAGVPLIGVPMLGDQWYNTEQYVIHNIGIKLNIDALTEEVLMTAIETIIQNDSYRRNIINLRQIMRDQPETPLQRAIWWSEYVIRHRDVTHLRAAGSGLTVVEYYEVAFVFQLLSLAAVIILSSLYLIVHFRNTFKNKYSNNKIKEQ